MGFPPRGFSGKTVSRARIFDLFTIPSNGKRFAATRYREKELMFPCGIKRSRVCRRHPVGVRRVSPGIFPLTSPRATNEKSPVLYRWLEHRGQGHATRTSQIESNDSTINHKRSGQEYILRRLWNVARFPCNSSANQTAVTSYKNVGQQAIRVYTIVACVYLHVYERIWVYMGCVYVYVQLIPCGDVSICPLLPT